jgi:hypothetical protein
MSVACAVVVAAARLSDGCRCVEKEELSVVDLCVRISTITIRLFADVVSDAL